MRFVIDQQPLDPIRSKNAWPEWLVYFLNGVAVQSEDVLSCAEPINGVFLATFEDHSCRHQALCLHTDQKLSQALI